MKRFLGILLSSAGILAGCGTNALSNHAQLVNEYTQSDIGTNLEKLGCQFSTAKPAGKQVAITVHNCSSISNHDAMTHIRENLVDRQDNIKPLIYFKNGR